MKNVTVLQAENAKPVKMWTQGVPVGEDAKIQLINTAKMPFIFNHIAVMPNVYAGKESAVGCVIPTVGAVIPATVGADIGCGIMAIRTSLKADDLPQDLTDLHSQLEVAVPHGPSSPSGSRGKGAWQMPPVIVAQYWAMLLPTFNEMTKKNPHLKKSLHYAHLGTLGTGNHFLELSLDEENQVWIVLHSGSRGIGHAIGQLFSQLAQDEMEDKLHLLPDRNLAYFQEGSRYFDDYLQAVSWAQQFAQYNREIMMLNAIEVLRKVVTTPFCSNLVTINCHHNSLQKESHFGQEIYVTRKGALSAKGDELGIILGLMGEQSYIVRGLGNAESFHSCSHGTGRIMNGSTITYKNIDAVMQAQNGLVDVVHQLKQILCIKGEMVS